MPSSRRWTVLAALGLVLSGGCAEGNDDPAPVPLASADLPPSGTSEMAKAYDAKLAPLGWRVQRSSLEEQHFDTSTSIPPGRRHLAVYLRPIGEPTTQDYIDALARVTRVFVPSVFEDHAGLASFDVCLEPTEARDPSNYPKPLTQVLVVRRQAAQFDWASARAVDVVAGSKKQPPVFALHVDDLLRKTPEWGAIDRSAG
jgi:hypothetical protein